KLVAYELGYRRRISRRVSVDVATFYNDYFDLRDGAAQPPAPSFAPVAHLVVPIIGNNNLSGHTYGVESLIDIAWLKGWKLRGSYSFLGVNTRQSPGPGSLAPPEFDEPRHQAYLHWAVNIRQMEFDITPRVLSSLRSLDVPAYAELDARVGWRPTRRLEV